MEEEEKSELLLLKQQQSRILVLIANTHTICIERNVGGKKGGGTTKFFFPLVSLLLPSNLFDDWSFVSHVSSRSIVPLLNAHTPTHLIVACTLWYCQEMGSCLVFQHESEPGGVGARVPVALFAAYIKLHLRTSDNVIQTLVLLRGGASSEKEIENVLAALENQFSDYKNLKVIAVDVLSKEMFETKK
jgi:hypothetical protein